MKDLLEAGVHFGHQTKRSNPKMKPFIFTKRKGINIIDLQKTVELAETAFKFARETVAHGGKILFVGTKKQARMAVEEAAQKCEMPFISLRWLGGLMTNFAAIRNSIDNMKKIEGILDKSSSSDLTKKELLQLERKKNKLNELFKGIRDMTQLPQAIFVIDSKNEEIAVKEANKLKIPVIGVVDTNGDPTMVDYPIPGNDDAIRAISLFTTLISKAVQEGRKQLLLKKEGEDDSKKEKTKDLLTEKERLEEKYAEYDVEETDKITGVKEIMAADEKTPVAESETDEKEKEEKEVKELVNSSTKKNKKK
ncbi:MAG: 30S ribosomal protein S2 [Spirochaetes bacterium]|nr:30S ribosomal protein S2 [Spirochaetota bacterium]